MTRESTGVDVVENRLRKAGNLLGILLKDRTTNANIIWGTKSYETRGAAYNQKMPIMADLITGLHGMLIQPRSAKSLVEQRYRTKERAEVFTPLKVVQTMNDAIDAFESSAHEVDELWHAYVREPRLEVACGEAPFIVSRYDPSVEFSPLVPIKERVGFLDRKLQVVSNHCSTVEDWIFWSKEAFKASYGYEWQGDNLLIGRENLLYSFIEHYREKFGEDPSLGQQEEIAEIVSWNLFQMDGLKCVIPMSCHSEYLGNDNNLTLELVEDIPAQTIEQDCEGCRSDLLLLHNGTYALIMDWEVQEPQRFVDLIAQPTAALPSW